MSLLLHIAARYLLPVLILFSLFLLMRGHNEPGGGFTGGLVAASAIALYAIAFGEGATRRLLSTHPRNYVVAGIAVAFFSGLVGLVTQGVFLVGVWDNTPIPIIGKIGTPFIFDIGVYLAVFGVTLTILLALMDEPSVNEE
ncbi:Na+/H+ antiporter subunit B [bacterium]|jgi:multicomponent Na+:H+ antiporter subunit B|nr:Na+/H+ antiporter subunit B [bacterium]